MNRDETPRADPALATGMFRELLWVHSMIREDLDTVRRLAGEVQAGAPPAAVSAAIDELQTERPLWRLRANCLYYCRVVHTHHTIEDVHIFPALRRADPALGPAVDRLEADHLRIGDQLNAVAAATRDLGRADTAAHRARLVSDLDALADHLLAHLSFEEGAIGPTLSTWNRWPTGE